MAARHEMVYEHEVESLRIPACAHTFEGFWRWVDSDAFPGSGRIDFLGGEIEADLNPEDLFTHGALKVEIVRTLGNLAIETGLWTVQSDRCRFRSPFASITTEPDVLAVFRESVESGRVRLVPSLRGKGQNSILAFEGAVDLIVEIVSNSSIGKDLKRLPPFYARAGVRELWLLDARKASVRGAPALRGPVMVGSDCHSGPTFHADARRRAADAVESRSSQLSSRLDRRLAPEAVPSPRLGAAGHAGFTGRGLGPHEPELPALSAVLPATRARHLGADRVAWRAGARTARRDRQGLRAPLGAVREGGASAG